MDNKDMNHEHGYTDGGQNPYYEGLFEGETESDKERRIQWAMNEDQLPWPGMMAAFERYYRQSWFEKAIGMKRLYGPQHGKLPRRITNEHRRNEKRK